MADDDPNIKVDSEEYTVTLSWKAFVAGQLLAMDMVGRTDDYENISEEDCKIVRHAAHLLFPTEYTEEEFKDEC
jgi:hypothetical protein